LAKTPNGEAQLAEAIPHRADGRLNKTPAGDLPPGVVPLAVISLPMAGPPAGKPG
jgi:hypothetical protein